MAPTRNRPERGALSPLLTLLIEVLERSRGGGSSDATALRALGELAVVEIPRNGVFAPKDEDTCRLVERIAAKHLGLKEPRRAFFRATAAVKPFARRDEIESAANHLRTVAEQAYFFTGLAFGVTLADLGGCRCRSRSRPE